MKQAAEGASNAAGQQQVPHATFQSQMFLLEQNGLVRIMLSLQCILTPETCESIAFHVEETLQMSLRYAGDLGLSGAPHKVTGSLERGPKETGQTDTSTKACMLGL